MKRPRRYLTAPAGFALWAILLSQTARSSTSTPIPTIPQSAFHPMYPSVVYETSPPIERVHEPIHLPLHTPRPIPSQVPQATVEPKPVIIHSSHSISGLASWYCLPGRSICTRGYPSSGAYAAAGPRLRAALGNWRGRHIKVNGIPVTISDWCQCFRGEANEKLIDLYHSVFVITGGTVTITWE